MELAVVVADEILVMRNSHLIEQVAFSGDTSAFTNSYSKVLLEASGIISVSYTHLMGITGLIRHV